MNTKITPYTPPTVLNISILHGHNIMISEDEFVNIFGNREVFLDLESVTKLISHRDDQISGLVNMLLSSEQVDEYCAFLLTESAENASFAQAMADAMLKLDSIRKQFRRRIWIIVVAMVVLNIAGLLVAGQFSTITIVALWLLSFVALLFSVKTEAQRKMEQYVWMADLIKAHDHQEERRRRTRFLEFFTPKTQIPS